MVTGSASSRSGISNRSFAVSYLVTRNVSSENNKAFFPFLLSFTLVWICLNAREGSLSTFPWEWLSRRGSRYRISCTATHCPPRIGIQTPKSAELYCRQLFLEHLLFVLLLKCLGNSSMQVSVSSKPSEDKLMTFAPNIL